MRADLDTREAAIYFRQGELAQKESALEQTRNGLKGALASARQALEATQSQLEEAVRSRQESDARTNQLQQQVEEMQAALEQMGEASGLTCADSCSPGRRGASVHLSKRLLGIL